MSEQSSRNADDPKETATSSPSQNGNKKSQDDASSADTNNQSPPKDSSQSTNTQSDEAGSSNESSGSTTDSDADQTVDTQPPDESATAVSAKNPAAVSLGRLGGLKGGKARARSLTKRERSEAARKAARARWRKKEQT